MEKYCNPPGRASKYLSPLLPLLLALLLLCSGCAASPRQQQLLHDGTLERYAHHAAQALPGYVSHKGETDEFVAALNRGDAAACFDIQAHTVLQNFHAYWYPGGTATVVIAADRSRTQAHIRTWSDLPDAGEAVSFTHDLQLSRTCTAAMVLSSIAYGLEGEHYSIPSALELLHRLHLQGDLIPTQADTPILICLDYQAAALKEQGRDLEIIVPTEGTLTFTAGILSGVPLRVDSQAAAAQAGLHSDRSAPEDSSAAVPVPDMEHLIGQTVHTARQIQRDVLGIRHHSSADHTEHVLSAVVFLLCAVFWSATVLRRSMRRDIRALAFFLSALVIGWTLLRLFKWQLPTLSLANRICWYSFYLFQLPIPIVLLWLSLIIDKPERAALRPPRPVVRSFICYVLIMLVVYTNDLHRLVWQFDLQGDWNNVYSYGPVFYLITLYNYGLLLAAIFNMFHKSLKAPRRIHRILPALATALMAGYTIAYVSGAPFVRQSDMTITTCSIAIFFFEAAMRSSLVPVNTRYAELFSKTPLNMQLLDHNGKCVLRAQSASPISPELWEKLRSCRGGAVERDSNTLLYATPIRGGMVVWEEDISSLNLLHRDTRRSIQNLSTANRLLLQEENVRRKALQSRISEELFSAMERESREKAERLSVLVRTPPHRTDPKLRSARIVLLLCHIKRRCNLFFLAHEGSRITAQEFSAYLDELGELAEFQGTKTMLHCSLSGSMDIHRAKLCYDFFFEVLDWALTHSISAVLGTLIRSPQETQFRLMTDNISRPWQLPPYLADALEQEGGSLTCKDLEESVGITLTFPNERRAEHG